MMYGPRKIACALLFLAVSFTAMPVAGEEKEDGQKNKKDDVEAIGERDVGKGMNFYSLEEEIALGKSLAQQVEQQARLLQDPVVTEYVNRVGQNLVRNSDAQVPFTIKVVDSDDVNAFALPGGFFFVNTGLLLATETESELAGVMSHEIAHVAARHGTRNASKAELVNWLTIPLIFLGGPVGFGARSAAGLLIPMKFLQFSRGAEREADYLGLQYLYKTGYDPQAFVDFFEKIQAREKSRPGTLAKAFSSHPMTPDRISAAQEEIGAVLPGRPEYIVSTSEYELVKKRLQVLLNRGRVEEAAGTKDRPTLRRSTQPVPLPETSPPETSEEDEDARPTLQRRY
ncbi:MAG: M48 family metalloprotease [Acidobacteria bacterium]|nr:M48 family metalloprotease [Acidobacteriota bacterium]